MPVQPSVRQQKSGTVGSALRYVCAAATLKQMPRQISGFRKGHGSNKTIVVQSVEKIDIA
jgi:hypothetical protein